MWFLRQTGQHQAGTIIHKESLGANPGASEIPGIQKEAMEQKFRHDTIKVTGNGLSLVNSMAAENRIKLKRNQQALPAQKSSLKKTIVTPDEKLVVVDPGEMKSTSRPLSRALSNGQSINETNDLPVPDIAGERPVIKDAGLARVEKKPVVDERVDIFSPDEENNHSTVVLTNIADDNKNVLRGLFRKTSRFINRNASLKASKRTGIHIGNIEIAFQ